MNRNISSGTLKSVNDLNTDDIMFSNIKIEYESCDNDSLTNALPSKIDSMCESSSATNQNLHVEEVICDYVKSENEDEDIKTPKSSILASALVGNIYGEGCSYKTEQVYVKTEYTSDEEVTQQDNDNSESYTVIKSEPGSCKSGNVEDSNIRSDHDKDMFMQKFSSYYRTEVIDIKTEHLSDNEHTSHENIEDHFENQATAHTAEESYTCAVCGEIFTQANLLTEHMWAHKLKERPTCPQCGKSFITMGVLKNHMKLHARENSNKPHKCEKCGKAFSDSSNLNRHVKIHTEIKPHECKDCGKTFRRPDDLNTHMRLHTGEKPYSCKECGKAFSRMDVLNRHMRYHTGEKPYSCDVCGKSFSDTGNLSSHIKIHTGEKPHVCKDCGKGFRQLSHLNAHMRNHSGERPYSCNECGKAYRQMSHLNVHMKFHTGNNQKPNGRSVGKGGLNAHKTIGSPLLFQILQNRSD